MTEKLTAVERDLLQELLLRPNGAPVRDPELKQAVLDLARRSLVCDPHAMGNALFTRITDAGRVALGSKPAPEQPKTYHIAWNEARTVGVICEDQQMAYELRKGALNSLGIVTGDFVEAWAEMTVDDNCTIQDVEI